MSKTVEQEFAEINALMKKIEKAYGSGLIEYGNNAIALHLTRIPTGSFTLDVELGGGWPEERISVIAGRESSGKTTLLLKAIAEAQRVYPNRPAAIIDVEGTLDLSWAQRLGVDLHRMLVIQPDYTEQAMDIADALVRSRGVSLLGIDSLAAMVPAAELEASMEKNQMGLAGSLNSKFLRKITQALRAGRKLADENDNKTTIIFSNQLREKIGAWGNPEIMPGGRAIRFYPSIICMLQQGDALVKPLNGVDTVVAQEVKFLITKNKTAPPRRQGVFYLYNTDVDEYAAGEIDRVREVVTYGILYDIIIKKGAWYYLSDGTKFQGMDRLLFYLKQNPLVLMELEVAIMGLVKDGGIKSEEAALEEYLDEE